MSSSYPHLEKLSIGCVQYLNAKPLIHGYEGKVRFDHPVHLAHELSAGTLDVALVPTFELMRLPHYDVVDGISISSRGIVYSVFLAYQGKLDEVKTVTLDMASLTSVHLLQCILGEFHGMSPDYVSPEKCTDKNAARLLIGNQAIDFRHAHGESYQYLDLGEEWMKQTSLPFVFAVWLMRRNVPAADQAAEELRQIKQYGTASIPAIVCNEKRYEAEFARYYLEKCIRFDLGPEEKKGMERFRELLAKRGLIDDSSTPLVFI